MSKRICNTLIILFIMVSFTVTIFAVIKKADWKAVVIPLILACLVLVMYQGVIYKGKKEKLLSQLPWEHLPSFLSKGHKVTIGSSNTTIHPKKEI